MDTVTEIEFTPAMPSNLEPTSLTPAPTPQIPATTGGDPFLTMIERAASDPRVDIEKMDRLLQMKERHDAKAAQIEYDAAMSRAQEEMRPIRANLENPQTRSEYADYAALDRAIRPIYSRHGFSLSFGTGDTKLDNHVRVVCTVAAHGHREYPFLDMPADGKGARGNDVMTKTHATGAAITYGKRYLLGMIFNLAVTRDDDGNGADGISDEERLSTGPRDPETGKLLSTYDAAKNARAKDIADRIVQSINLSPNREAAKEIWAAEQVVPKGKRSSPLGWLKDNAPGQHLRCQTVYENVVGLE